MIVIFAPVLFVHRLYLRFKPIVGVVNVYTMVPCHKTAAALGELYISGKHFFLNAARKGLM
jgi:hypothetical protein